MRLLYLLLFAGATAVCLSLVAARARPVFTLPYFTDDTQTTGISGVLLASYLAEVKNMEQAYPFDINLNITFAYSYGPELFYLSVPIANKTRPPIFLVQTYSSSVQLISTAANVFGVQIMAAGATSPYLSSKSEYPNVWRTVASDSIQMQAWVDICTNFQWANVAFIEEGSLYGHGSAESFEILSAKKGIKTTRFPVNTELEIASALNNIRNSKVKIIMAPCTIIMESLLESARKFNMLGKGTGYVWILCTPELSSLLHPDMSPYYGSLFTMESKSALEKEYKLPKYEELLKVAYNNVTYSYNLVNPSNRLRNNVTRRTVDESVPYIWMGGMLPLSLSRALLATWQSTATFYNEFGKLPNASELSLALSHFSGTLLGRETQFDHNQDAAQANLTLYNVQRSNTFHEFGSWDPHHGLVLNKKNKIIWPDGTTKIPDDGIALERYFTYKSVFGVFLLVFSALVGIVSLATLILTLKYFNSPVFRFSSPYYLLWVLAAILLIGGPMVLYLGRPSDFSCLLHIWTWYIGYSLFFAATSVKGWRGWMILRHFSAYTKRQMSSGNSRKRRLGNWKLTLYTGLILTPMVIQLIARSILAHDHEIRTLSKDRNDVLVVCASVVRIFKYIGRMLVVLPMMASCFLSFKARDLAIGRGEAKLSLVAVCIVSAITSIGFILSMAGEWSSPMHASIVMAIFDVVVVIAIWSLTFAPKLYIAVFFPHENKAEFMMETYSNALALPFKPQDPTSTSNPLLDDEY